VYSIGRLEGKQNRTEKLLFQDEFDGVFSALLVETAHDEEQTSASHNSKVVIHRFICNRKQYNLYMTFISTTRLEHKIAYLSWLNCRQSEIERIRRFNRKITVAGRFFQI
jgi:hypothetical protein